MSDEGYAHPELLVDTDWLAEHLNDPNLRIVDMDNRDAYRRAHIPGAVSPRVDHYFKNPDDTRFAMTPEQFQEQMETMGIGDDTQVVAYDGFGSLYAARLWWLFAYFGHSNIKVLNGGWYKWLEEGRPVSGVEPLRPARASFTPVAHPEVVASAEHIMERIGRDGFLAFDVRSIGEYTGTISRGNKRKGHVPGSVNKEWLNFVTGDSRQTLKPAAELRQMFADLGVTPEKEIVTICQGGIRAAHGMFTLTLLGYPNVRNYDGSMGDWSNREDTPLEM